MLLSELGRAGAIELGIQLNPGAIERLLAYGASVSHFPTAVKEVQPANAPSVICIGVQRAVEQLQSWHLQHQASARTRDGNCTCGTSAGSHGFMAAAKGPPGDVLRLIEESAFALKHCSIHVEYVVQRTPFDTPSHLSCCSCALQFEWRNGWFYNISKRFREQGIDDPCKLHTALLHQLDIVKE